MSLERDVACLRWCKLNVHEVSEREPVREEASRAVTHIARHQRQLADMPDAVVLCDDADDLKKRPPTDGRGVAGIAFPLRRVVRGEDVVEEFQYVVGSSSLGPVSGTAASLARLIDVRATVAWDVRTSNAGDRGTDSPG